MKSFDWMEAVDGVMQTQRHGPRREVLALNANLTRLTSGGAARLTGALTRLHELLLSGSHFPTSALDDEAAAALLAAGGCERLAVNAVALHADALTHLLRGLGTLRTLDIAGTALSADAVRNVLRNYPGLADLRLGMAPPQPYQHRFTPILKDGEILNDVGTLLGLEALSLRGLEIDDETIRLPNLVGLARLDVGETRASDLTAQALARSPALRELHIDGTLIGDTGLEALAKHGGLAILDISDTQVTPAGIMCLAGQRQLRQLSLRGLGLSDVQADLFSGLTGLQSLDVSRTGVGPRVIEALTAAPSLNTLKLPYVTSDTVRGCIGLHGLKRLTLKVIQPAWSEIVQLDALEELAAPLDAAAQLPPNLRRLETENLDKLSVQRLPQAKHLEVLHVSSGAAHLADLLPSELPELRELLAFGDDLTDAALRRLLASPAMEALYVSDSAITQHGLKALSEAKFIHTLELRNIPLDRATAERISRLQRLHCLDVPGTGLGDAEIALLAQTPNLQSLALDPGQITASSMSALATAPLIELYIYGSPILPAALAHVGALNDLMEIRIIDAEIEAEHVEIIASLPSLRLVQGRFASQEVADRLATLRPDLRGFDGTVRGGLVRRGRAYV